MSQRMGKRWDSPLARFVRSFGASRLAAQLGIHENSVYHWIADRNHPRPEHARELVELSRGALTFETIYHLPGKRTRDRESER